MKMKLQRYQSVFFLFSSSIRYIRYFGCFTYIHMYPLRERERERQRCGKISMQYIAIGGSFISRSALGGDERKGGFAGLRMSNDRTFTCNFFQFEMAGMNGGFSFF